MPASPDQKFLGRVSETLRVKIRHERLSQNITFEQWLTALMAREKNYRNQIRAMHHEIEQLRQKASR